jgi:hypothetical protein
LYLGIWSVFGVANPYFYLMLGLITGLLHGMFIGVVLIPVFVDRGNEGFRAAAVQAAAHAVFGTVVGIFAALMTNQPGLFQEINDAFTSTLLMAGL